MRDVFPWSGGFATQMDRRSGLGNRAGATKQADLHCFVQDSGGPCIPQLLSGVAVVRPPGFAGMWAPVASAPPTLSPLRGPSAPSKHIIGEAYSGRKESMRVGKVAQLDALLRHMLQRFEETCGQREVDVTAIIGAAVLVFNGAFGSRRDELERHVALVEQRLPQHPLLARLAACGRLVVMALEQAQAPNSFFQRTMALVMAGKATITE